MNENENANVNRSAEPQGARAPVQTSSPRARIRAGVKAGPQVGHDPVVYGRGATESMNRLALLSNLGVAVVLLGGCASPEEPPPAPVEEEIRATRQLEVAMTWSCGETGDEVGFTPNEDGQFTELSTVTLGPLEDCRKPAALRAPGAVCEWSAPSTCWKVNLRVGASEGDSTLDVYGFAGDADSTFHGRLPIATIPRITAWELGVSPDNAGGAWGAARLSLRRVR